MPTNPETPGGPDQSSPETIIDLSNSAMKALSMLTGRAINAPTKSAYGNIVASLNFGSQHRDFSAGLEDQLDNLEGDPEVIKSLNDGLLAKDPMYSLILKDILNTDFEETTDSGPETKAGLRQLAALWRLRFLQAGEDYDKQEFVVLLSIKMIYGRLVYDISSRRSVLTQQRDLYDQ